MALAHCILFHSGHGLHTQILPGHSAHDSHRFNRENHTTVHTPLHLSRLRTLSISRAQDSGMGKGTSVESIQIYSQSMQEPGPKMHSQFTKRFWYNPNISFYSLDQKTSSYFTFQHLAKQLDSCKPNEEDISREISILGAGLSAHKARAVINKMRNPVNVVLALNCFLQKFTMDKKVSVCNSALRVLAKNKDFHKSELLVEDMIAKGIKPSKSTFLILIECAFSCSLPHEAMRWFNKMPEHGCIPSSYMYLVMLLSYTRSGDINATLSFYNQARREIHNISLRIFTALIYACVPSRLFPEAFNLYKDMKQRQVMPDLMVYKLLLSAFRGRTYLVEVREVHKDLVAYGYLPSKPAYVLLLRAYCWIRSVPDAISVYREMKDRGMKLQSNLYACLLLMFSDLSCVDEAVSIFEEMKRSDVKPNSSIFCILIRLLAATDRIAMAEEYMNKMLMAGFKPRIFELFSLVRCYARARRTDDVMQIIDETMESEENVGYSTVACLLYVAALIPEKLEKLVFCIRRADPILATLVDLLIKGRLGNIELKNFANTHLKRVGRVAGRTYCSGLIGICSSLHQTENSLILLNVGIELRLYERLQFRSEAKWSLHVENIAYHVALTALHAWLIDLTKALERGDELPEELAIFTGSRTYKLNEGGTYDVVMSFLKKLSSPFHSSSEESGWFIASNSAVKSWIKELPDWEKLLTE